MTRFLSPLFGALVLAFALVGCDAVAPEASGDLALNTVSGVAASATALSDETVTGSDTIDSECVRRYVYSNNDGGFTFWDVQNLSGTATIVGTGLNRALLPYADVKGGQGGTVKVRAHNDTVSPYFVTKTVTINGSVACA